MVLPVLLLASAAQPTYRLGAFIEATRVDSSAAPWIDEPVGIDLGSLTEEDVPDPEPSWSVELVALFPAGIGAGEQLFRAPAGERLFLEANSASSAFCHPVGPVPCRSARLVRAERSMADLFYVVAHPIHTHAPPPVL